MELRAAVLAIVVIDDRPDVADADLDPAPDLRHHDADPVAHEGRGRVFEPSNKHEAVLVEAADPPRSHG